MNDDIVTRLRLRPTILRKNQFGDMETDRAATELFNGCHSMMRDAADEIERLRQRVETLTAERDEARREICINEANELAFDLERKGVFGITGKSMAEKRKWDCYKEDGK